MPADMNVKGILYAIAVTAALVVLLALLRLFFNKLGARVEATLAHSDWRLKFSNSNCCQPKDSNAALCGVSAVSIHCQLCSLFTFIFQWY